MFERRRVSPNPTDWWAFLLERFTVTYGLHVETRQYDWCYGNDARVNGAGEPRGPASLSVAKQTEKIFH